MFGVTRNFDKKTNNRRSRAGGNPVAFVKRHWVPAFAGTTAYRYHSPMNPGPHPNLSEPSPWITRFAPMVPAGGRVLDVACGGGRHARFFAARGHPVDAVDRDAAAFGEPAEGITFLCADLESPAATWPYDGQRFAAVVVTNYLYRPLLPTLVKSVAPGGLLLYETFALGNERYGKPSNPDFLLTPGELLEVVQGRLKVLAYEDTEVDSPKPAMVQRIAAVRPG